ncbi:hypothetical protein [Methylobacterium frigidaeris]|uniref:hypothetical protein n=1 Tax=Methylobacterium frigidaeris TaxID=2038277 RepID=UPI001054EB61|nr:hypothetical protein [Methylobacterium frigidaeris]
MIKRIDVEVDTTATVSVSIAVFTKDEIVDELERLTAITSAEAEYLRDGRSIEHLYDPDDLEIDTSPQIDADAWENAVDALRRGDLAEALIQLGRANPDLADLPYLAGRAGLAGA